MADDRSVERLVNLTFALLSGEQAGRAALSGQWLRSTVDGYAGRSEEASRRQFARDIATLRKAGVPVVSVTDEEGQSAYRLKREHYQLPPVEFTDREAAVLGLAGELGQAGELGTFARSGWTKLAASGANRSLEDITGTVVSTYSDLSRLTPELLVTVLRSVRDGAQVSMKYRRDAATSPVLRRLDPWGLVNRDGRLYLVGFDLDRDAPRAFRSTRISEVEITGAGTHPQGSHDLGQLVTETLRQGRELVDAQVALSPGKAQELRRVAEGRLKESGGIDVVNLHDVPRDWLVRTAAGYGAAAVVCSPDDVRDDVLRLLKEQANGQ